MNIIILGAPGVAKGTYAEFLEEKYNIPKISTGDMIRDVIKTGSELGRKMKGVMDKGHLVSDDIIMEMIKERLKDCKKGFILDGIPRTINQAKSLGKIAKINKVLNFVASEEIIIDRLGGRLTCSNCGTMFHIRNVKPKKPGICDKCSGKLYQREDQSPEIIKTRLKVYEEKTKPLIDYYKKKKLLINIDTSPPIKEKDKVLAKIDKALI